MAYGPRPGQRNAQPSHRAVVQSQRAIGRAVSDGGQMCGELILNIGGQWFCLAVGEDGQEHMRPHASLWSEE